MIRDKRTKEQVKQDFLKMTDKDIDYSDIPDFPDEFWASATMNSARNKSKKPVSIRLKPTTIKIIKLQGKKENIPYQTIISNLLDNYAIRISNNRK